MKKIFFLLIIFIIHINIGAKLLDTIRIKGEIPNLPDGKIYLFKDTFNNIIDSTEVKNGKFFFKYYFKEKTPQYIGFVHYNNERVKTLIFFSKKDTKEKIKKVDRIISDSIITFYDSLNIDTKFSNSTTIYSTTKVKGEKQIDSYLDSEIDLFENIENTKVLAILQKIKKYPYSYHLLYEIEDHKNNFSVSDLKQALALFNNNVKKSSNYKALLDFIKLKIKSQKEKIISTLKNNSGKRGKIIAEKYKKHLLIFWASWCGPCLNEIPNLKSIYKKNKNVEFVSISIDEDEIIWLKKVGETNMPWKQLIANKKDQKLFEASLGFSNVVPYTVLVDNNFKILYKTTGLISEENLEKILIENKKRQ